MISLCMIVRNEEKHLRDFLNSVKDGVDEIIIVDTGSDDKTKAIAKEFTKKVYDFRWDDDFSLARNFCISKASKDWILVLDPDEVIDKSYLVKIRDIIRNNQKDVLGYRLIQHTYYKDKLISVRGICRIFKNNKGIRFVYPVHETVRESIKKLNGRIGKTGIVIRNYPKICKEKKEYYLRLLKIKKKKYPNSSADREIENELSPR